MMANAILLALAPIFFVMLLGYGAGRLHIVDNHQCRQPQRTGDELRAAGVAVRGNRSAPRSEMFAQAPLFLVLGVMMLLLYFAWYLAARRFFEGVPARRVAAGTDHRLSEPRRRRPADPAAVAGQAGAVPVAVALAAGSILISPLSLIMSKWTPPGRRGEETAARQMLTALRRALHQARRARRPRSASWFRCRV